MRHKCTHTTPIIFVVVALAKQKKMGMLAKKGRNFRFCVTTGFSKFCVWQKILTKRPSKFQLEAQHLITGPLNNKIKPWFEKKQ